MAKRCTGQCQDGTTARRGIYDPNLPVSSGALVSAVEASCERHGCDSDVMLGSSIFPYNLPPSLLLHTPALHDLPRPPEIRIIMPASAAIPGLFCCFAATVLLVIVSSVFNFQHLPCSNAFVRFPCLYQRGTLCISSRLA